MKKNGMTADQAAELEGDATPFAAAPRLLAKRCALCGSPEFTSGVCGAHYLEFSRAPEFARVKTAIADWRRRVEGEK